jgi:hypothetical protein
MGSLTKDCPSVAVSDLVEVIEWADLSRRLLPEEFRLINEFVLDLDSQLIGTSSSPSTTSLRTTKECSLGFTEFPLNSPSRSDC